MDILRRPTLVLNKNWIPISTVSVKQALTMLFGEWIDTDGEERSKAEVLDPDTSIPYVWEDWIALPIKPGEAVVHGGCGQEIRAPEVIIVNRYHKIPKNQLNFNKLNLFKRDEETCQYCGKKPGRKNLSTDHVHPRSKGGANTWENCVTACVDCNQKKSDKTLKEAKMQLLRQPYKPGMEIIGQTNIKLKSWETFLEKKRPIHNLVDQASYVVPLQ